LRVPVKGGELQELVRSPGNSQNSALSPDGRWLAYSSAESGRLEVYVQAFGAGGTARSQVSTNGGLEAHWSRDGRALYYRQNTQLVMVPVEAGAAFLPGKPTVVLTDVVAPIVDSAETYDVAPDGRFVMMRPAEEQGGIAEVRILLNWFSDLRPASAR
jgi:hypothetical protein